MFSFLGMLQDLLVVLLITSSTLGHSSYFFEWAWPPFYISNYCPHIFGMLNIDHSCICHSFLTRWSPYSFGCTNTCWDWHFLIIDGNIRYLNPITLGCPLSSPILWKPSGSVLSLIVGFFGRLFTWARVCFIFNRCSFKYHVSTSSFMCRSKGKHLVINLSYHTRISFIFNPFLYITMYPSWLATSYGCPCFIMLVWPYHWWSKYPFASMPMQE